MVTITGYVMTPVFGGQEGELYNDVLYTNKDTGTLSYDLPKSSRICNIQSQSL